MVMPLDIGSIVTTGPGGLQGLVLPSSGPAYPVTIHSQCKRKMGEIIGAGASAFLQWRNGIECVIRRNLMAKNAFCQSTKRTFMRTFFPFCPLEIDVVAAVVISNGWMSLWGFWFHFLCIPPALCLHALSAQSTQSAGNCICNKLLAKKSSLRSKRIYESKNTSI